MQLYIYQFSYTYLLAFAVAKPLPVEQPLGKRDGLDSVREEFRGIHWVRTFNASSTPARRGDS